MRRVSAWTGGLLGIYAAMTVAQTDTAAPAAPPAASSLAVPAASSVAAAPPPAASSISAPTAAVTLAPAVTTPTVAQTANDAGTPPASASVVAPAAASSVGAAPAPASVAASPPTATVSSDKAPATADVPAIAGNAATTASGKSTDSAGNIGTGDAKPVAATTSSVAATPAPANTTTTAVSTGKTPTAPEASTVAGGAATTTISSTPAAGSAGAVEIKSAVAASAKAANVGEDAAAKTTLALPPVTDTETTTVQINPPTLGPDPSAMFPRPPALHQAIAFWTDIFGKYSENQSVVHSINDLGKVYTVLDYRDQAASMDPVRLSRLRAQGESAAREHINAMLKHIDALKNTPEKLNPEERRIYVMFAGSDDPKRFRREIGEVRVQRGLRERTLHALETASSYLPEMERIFASYKLPTMLTRLPLVESSFNVNAYSKDGAAGIWQFIPSSARIYMRLDEVVDDRRDVWFSTDAAARHLRDDYDALRDWPLAITAYNHGRGGIARGLVTVQGTSLSDLLQRYRNANFGFASRNFYAEFIAASDVERSYREQHPPSGSRGDTMHFDVVTTHDYLPYNTLRQLTGLDEAAFRALNPAYRPEVIDGRLYVPPGHEIRVPAGASPQFMAAYSALPESERYAHQRAWYTAYRVRRGDSLGKLAKRYGVSTVALREANSMPLHASIHAGQTLKIPARESAPVIASADKEKPARLLQVSQAVTAPYRLHRIEAGQTLGGIAKHYRTTVRALMELNELSDTRRLRAGSTIKVPSS